MEGIHYGGVVRNFLRVWVEYPLVKALKPNFKIRLERRIVTIPIKYEGVSNFYFTCGMIGHAESNCEYEEQRVKGKQFNQKLGAPPQQRRSNARFSISVDKSTSAWNIRFPEQRKELTKSATSSSKPPSHGNVDSHAPASDGRHKEMVDHKVENISTNRDDEHVKVTKEISEVLETGVQDMNVDNKVGALVDHGSGSDVDTKKGKVSFSGDYYLLGSSEYNVGQSYDDKSLAKGANKHQVDRIRDKAGGALRIADSGREIEKSKKAKLPMTPGIQEVVRTC